MTAEEQRKKKAQQMAAFYASGKGQSELGAKAAQRAVAKAEGRVPTSGQSSNVQQYRAGKIGATSSGVRPTPLNIAAEAARNRYSARRSVTSPNTSSIISVAQERNPIRPTPLDIALGAARVTGARTNRRMTHGTEPESETPRANIDAGNISRGSNYLGMAFSEVASGAATATQNIANKFLNDTENRNTGLDTYLHRTVGQDAAAEEQARIEEERAAAREEAGEPTAATNRRMTHREDAERINAAADAAVEEAKTETPLPEADKFVDFGDRYAAQVAEKYREEIEKAPLVAGVAQGVGGMIPTIAANFVVPGSGYYTTFANAAQGATDEAMAEGASEDMALLYGTAVGGLEVLIGKAFDGMAGALGKGAADELIEAAARNTFKNNTAAQGAFIFFANSLGEGVEEFATEYADALINRLTVQTDERSFGELSGDALNSLLIGSMTSAVIQGGQRAVNGAVVTAQELADDTVAQMEQAETQTEEENAAPVGGEDVKQEARRVVDKIAENAGTLSEMPTVSSLTGNEFKKSETDLVTQVGNFFRSIGNAVFRRGFGDVVLDSHGVRTDIAHGLGRAKAITFASVPDVIANGQQIDFQENWKGRGRDSYIFAAPVEIDGKKTFVGAVVLRGTDNRFYLHEVVDENGNVIYIKRDNSGIIKNGVTAPGGITVEPELSTEMITQPRQSVNRFPSPITDAVEARAAEATETPNDQAGIYGRSVGAATPLRGPQVESRTNLLEDLNLSEEARQTIYENTPTHELVSEALANERASAYEVRDSDGRLLNLNDIVWDLKEKADNFSQVGPEDVKLSERALVNLQREAQQTGDWSKFRRFNSEVVQTLKTTSGQMLQAWAEFSRSPSHMVAEAMDIMDAAVERSDDVEAAELQRDEIATKISQEAETIQAAIDAEDAESLRNLIISISTDRGYIPRDGIIKALGKVQSMEALQELAIMSSYGRALDMMPESFGRKLGTVQTLAHLLNPKTLLRNFISNTVFAPVDTIAHDVGIFTDFVLAAMQSGKGKGSVKQNRTVGFENPFGRRDAEYVATARVRNALDIREDRGGKYFGGGRVFDRNGNVWNRALNRAEGALGWGLNVTDAMQKAGTKAQSERALKGLVEAGGKVTQDVADRITEQEMLYRSFQRATGIGDLMQGAKDVLNVAGFGAETKRIKGRYSVREFGLGDLTTKYTTVPGALIHTAADYTPLAAFNVARDIAAMVKFNRADGDAETKTMSSKYRGMTNDDAAAMAQYNAAVGMGRMLTGTGIMMLGAMAIKAGLVGFRPYDRDKREEYAARNALGENGLQLNLNAMGRWFAGEGGEWKDGDLLMDLGQFQPIDTLVKIAAVIEDEDDEKWKRSIDAVVEGLASSIEELSMMQTARTVINDIRYRSDEESVIDTAKQIGIDILSGAATGFIPGPVRNLATAIDQYKRDTSADTAVQELLNKMIATIPGLRNTHPAKLDYTGQPMENENALLRTLNAQVLPMSVNTYREDKVLDYFDSLPGGSSLYPDVYAPSSFSNNGASYELNTEQQRAYLAAYRQAYYSLAQELEANSFVRAMSDDLQAETMKDLNSLAAQEAKRQAVEAAGGEFKRTSYNYLYDENGELLFDDPGSVIALRNAFNEMVDSDYQDSADFEKMYGWFQNQGNGVGWMSNTLYGDQLEIADAIGGLEKLALCMSAGMTPQEYGEAKAYHDELNRDANLSPSARATDFAFWLSNQGFTAREQSAAKRNLTFSFGGVVGADKYEELTDSGVSASDSNKVFDAIDALEPESGYSSVRDIQNYEAIANIRGMSDGDKLSAIGVYAGTDSKTYSYYKAAYDCGVELSTFVDTLRDIETYQTERGKSVGAPSQGELYLALHNSDINDEQRQQIYYAYATQRGWENKNYYGARSAGVNVYNEIQAARGQ